ncbi:MAG TPA: glycosyltransferase [Phycisphaerae bacterium]|jgi:glycosyltransferase involved in cell wall biosynthesis|nr:glycosyltransferase [Phycisphaerae bacterium]HOB75139.1 glycosyltransferase [Phycisphaerae bacterium]HOJ54639.1 glycosyltransferase [Phycisphaerae bacterium]HOL27265.1 glycosyltransferase [Phycisphaerae bacterium]HPP21065.1 glycosyltransferase [Phycisphaerae bacterium]
MVSIIIPAHNEESVIARNLKALTQGAAPGEIEVIVVCNGCTDRTARIARGFGEPVKVIEIEVCSKVAALNAGDAVAGGFPRFYIDADVVMDLESVRRMAAALERGEGLVAWPEPRTDLSRASWPVRAYYAVWRELPYNNHGGKVGAGAYALSREGRSRFGAFPDVINDDGFVRYRFEPAERITVPGACSIVEAPRTLASLVRVKTRVRVGQFQLRDRFPGSPVADRKSPKALLTSLLRRPRLWPCLPLYAGITLLVRSRARRLCARAQFHEWGRDESTRGSLVGVNVES